MTEKKPRVMDARERAETYLEDMVTTLQREEWIPDDARKDNAYGGAGMGFYDSGVIYDVGGGMKVRVEVSVEADV